jgi:6-phosphogluconolactonase
MLTFYKVSGAAEAANALQKRLLQELSGHKRVLWFVTGGSNIALSVAIMSNIPVESRANLAIMLTDERYGSFDHPDSNARQLREAGFDTSGATFIPVLTPENLSLEAACSRYQDALKTAFTYADVVIAQFGIGPDGHIAGILPHSPAVQARKLATGYDGGNFVRITITPPAFKHIDAAYAYACGSTRHLALVNLQQKKLVLASEPAQILKRLAESYVYNDQVEGKSV